MYKIGMTVDLAIRKLNEENKLSNELSEYLNTARLIRNRIEHRYKQPSIETIIEFIEKNKNMNDEMYKYIRSFL